MSTLGFTEVVAYISQINNERFEYKTKLERLEQSFKAMSEYNGDASVVIPLTYDKLVEGKYIWNFFSKKYVLVNKLFINKKGERFAQINGVYYNENEIIGTFYRYSFEH